MLLVVLHSSLVFLSTEHSAAPVAAALLPNHLKSHSSALSPLELHNLSLSHTPSYSNTSSLALPPLCHIHLHSLVSSPPSLSTPCRGLWSVRPPPGSLSFAFLFLSLFVSVCQRFLCPLHFHLAPLCSVSVSQLVANVVNSPLKPLPP